MPCAAAKQKHKKTAKDPGGTFAVEEEGTEQTKPGSARTFAMYAGHYLAERMEHTLSMGPLSVGS